MSFLALSRNLSRQLLAPVRQQAVARPRMSTHACRVGSEGGIPYANLPFSAGSRYTYTLVFALFFGTGFWAPSLVIWYSMAKGSL